MPHNPASPDPPGGGVVSFPGEDAEALLSLSPVVGSASFPRESSGGAQTGGKSGRST